MFLTIGDITSNENPQDSQEAESNAAGLQWTLLKAIERVAEQEQISKSKARKLIFGAKLPKEVEEGEEGDSKAIAKNDVEVDKDEPSIEDYLTEAEFMSLSELRGSRRQMLREAMTSMMRYRMAYTIDLTEAIPTGKSGEFSVSILPSFFAAPGGSEFLCKTGVWVLAKPLKSGDRVATFKATDNPPSEKVKSEESMYLLDSSTGLEKVGAPDWNENMTRNSPYGVQAALRNFFEAEAAGLSQSELSKALDEANEGPETEPTEADEDEAMGKS